MFRPGTRIGSYEVLARLRAGGMATLLLGRRTGAGGFSRLVAIKLLHEHLTDDASMVRMFLDEARLSARIHHPNVVHVEELGEHEGRYYLVMEYIHGCSLAQTLQGLRAMGRAVTPEVAVYVAAEIAEGLHAAHDAVGEHGEPLHVVHRDVSPQNVLIAHTGHVKVIDFGVAQAQGRLHRSSVSTVLGKIGYMSPEQLIGDPVDRRTDVYALGVVLWELLTMRPLFQAPTQLRDLSKVARPPVSPPSRIVRGISSALDEVVLAALSMKPSDRPATALELRRALIEACPSVTRVDAPAIAMLMRGIVGGELDERRKQLPSEVSSEIERQYGLSVHRRTQPYEPDDVVDVVDELTIETAPAPGTAHDVARKRSSRARRVGLIASALVVAVAVPFVLASLRDGGEPDVRSATAHAPRTAQVMPVRTVVDPPARAIDAPAAVTSDAGPITDAPARRVARSARGARAKRGAAVQTSRSAGGVTTVGGQPFFETIDLRRP